MWRFNVTAPLDIAVTVENPEMVLTTVVLEYSLARIAVTGAGFVEFYCCLAIEKR